jgi:hypothetical protein
MVDPMGGADEDLEAPTTYVGDIDGGPSGCSDGDPRAPTINIKNVNDGPPGRH